MNVKVTEEQYRSALQLIDRYHREQLDNGESLMKLLEDSGASNLLMDRIAKFLQGLVDRGYVPFTYITDITALYFMSSYTRQDLMMQRSVGKLTVDEFERVMSVNGYKFGNRRLQ
ncbi:MAG TPA: hypothetical protein VK541_21220 [Pedobacter sp.]|uniref:hypothetical protein n=1 Tax=Pedobacter sp. TaxID=1411316 RepID=UPI002C749E74|nr:hypothetical protein [Pedobacter sp.]HMI05021.1 hypothetical protein [Pedobacter sp.]